MLPILERIQVGNQKKSDQGLYCDSRRRHAELNIWGKKITALKGNTTWSKPNTVARDSVKIPFDSLKLHNEIIFVNKIPFFLTPSRKICFTAVNHLANRTVPQIFAAFKEIYQYYLHRGFCITTVHSDGKFTPLQALIASLPGGFMINLASANKHVPDIEWKIRVVKERCQAARHGLPFQKITKLLTIHIVFQTVKLLNFFPAKGGISDTSCPARYSTTRNNWVSRLDNTVRCMMKMLLTIVRTWKQKAPFHLVPMETCGAALKLYCSTHKSKLFGVVRMLSQFQIKWSIESRLLAANKPINWFLPRDTDVQFSMSKSQEWIHQTLTISRSQEGIHRTLIISRSHEWMWKF